MLILSFTLFCRVVQHAVVMWWKILSMYLCWSFLIVTVKILLNQLTETKDITKIKVAQCSLVHRIYCAVIAVP